MRGRIAMLSCVPALLVLGAVSAVEVEPVGESEPGAQAIHVSTAKIEQALVAATVAFLRENSRDARSALDVIHENSRTLHPDEVDVVGSDVLAYDRAFHETLDRSRELAGAGELDAAFDQFVWVQRACRTCHALSRERGLMPVPKVN